MAARFHSPPRPPRPRRSGAPTLTLVAALLAPALSLHRPPVRHPRPLRPVRLVLLSCPVCDLAADPMPAPAAEQLAGTHDDLHHGGRPTAVLRTHPRRPSPASPHLDGAA